MRREGVKFPADVVLVERPVRGWLIVRPAKRQVSQDGRWESCIEAALQAEDGHVRMHVLPTLYNVWIRRWQGHHLILLGEEYAPGSGVPGVFWPQAWWVRIVERRDAPVSRTPDQITRTSST